MKLARTNLADEIEEGLRRSRRWGCPFRGYPGGHTCSAISYGYNVLREGRLGWYSFRGTKEERMHLTERLREADLTLQSPIGRGGG